MQQQQTNKQKLKWDLSVTSQTHAKLYINGLLAKIKVLTIQKMIIKRKCISIKNEVAFAFRFIRHWFEEEKGKGKKIMEWIEGKRED